MRRSSSALKALLPVLLLLSGCGEASGPVEIKWDRDVCELCGMIISSPRYVAELRLADGKVHKFDDLGDALNWLEQQCVRPEQAKEIWVMESENGKIWLDARKVFYRRGKSPMNYNFAAIETAGEGALDFAAMRAQALRSRYACPKPER
jgi:nitrous oxide reductase accessory protein NosL